MTEFVYSLLDISNLSFLSAFLIGALMSISPCPLATNITAIAYVSKDIKSKSYVLLSGLFYTLGRAISYTVLGLFIYFGVSSFQVAQIFQGWGDKVLGPILILIALFMLGVLKLNISSQSGLFDKFKNYLGDKGYLGSLFLGILFALAFCPYSGILFFGMFVPLLLQSSEALILPLFFSIGTALPVIIFSLLLAFSFKMINRAFKFTQKLELYLRYFVGGLFLLMGIYYLQYLVYYLFNLFKL